MAKTRKPGWWYPWIFVGGMAVVVVVNAIMIYFAVSTWTGLETEGHYEKGLAYNEKLKGAEAQAALGWAMKVDLDRGSLAVGFRDKAGAPIEDLMVQAVLFRPTHEGFDQSLTLQHGGAGVYRTAVEVPLPGQWDVKVHAFKPGADFQERRRVELR